MDKLKILSKLTGLKAEWSKATHNADLIRKNNELTGEAKNSRIEKIQEDYKVFYLDKLQSAINEANKQLQDIVNNYIASIPKLDIQEKNYIVGYYSNIIRPCGVAREIDYLYNNIKDKKGDIYLEITSDSIKRIENTEPKYQESGLNYEDTQKLAYLKDELEGKNVQGKEDLQTFIQSTLNFLYSAGMKGNFCSAIEDGAIKFDVAI